MIDDWIVDMDESLLQSLPLFVIQGSSLMCEGGIFHPGPQPGPEEEIHFAVDLSLMLYIRGVSVQIGTLNGLEIRGGECRLRYGLVINDDLMSVGSTLAGQDAKPDHVLKHRCHGHYLPE